MESLFNVVFTGELKPGTDRDDFIKAFSQRFQCSEAKAAEVLDAGKAVMMKRSVSREVAENFRSVLEALGMVIRLEPQSTPQESAPASPPDAAASPASANPYQAPTAQLQETGAEGEMTGPVSVPFSHGSSWISRAFSDYFKSNALGWIGAFVVFAVISIVIQLIPLLGMVVSSLLSPVFVAGMMLGAKAQDEGEDFTVGHLFAGFKESTGQLVLVGLFYLIGTIAVMLIAGIVMGSSFAMLGMMEGDPAAGQAMAQNPMAILLPVLVMLALLLPLMMAYWFAPALVALDGISAVSAMKLSFVGCLRNVLPFLLYGIVMFVLSILAAIPLFLGFLVLLPVMIASMYTAYRDIYYPEG
jgi:uncharacterized membrane protein